MAKCEDTMATSERQLTKEENLRYYKTRRAAAGNKV